MACLSCYCYCATKPLVFASLPSNLNDSPSPHSNTTRPSNLPIPATKTKTRPTKKKHSKSNSKLQQQLTLIRIEHAVGSGSYRDSDPTGPEERGRDSILKGLLPNSGSALEGPLEKKLRETGKWVSDQTEGMFQSSGKKILMFFFKWVMPIYIFMFLVTSGAVRLPFSTPLLDDLLM